MTMEDIFNKIIEFFNIITFISNKIDIKLNYLLVSSSKDEATSKSGTLAGVVVLAIGKPEAASTIIWFL